VSNVGWDPPSAGDPTGAGGAAGSAALPVAPYTSLAVHYGMLLGVNDFDVLAANPRGKLQLHQAWQHGPGVVWGYPVSRAADDDPRLAVGPGLAVDGWGREISVPVRMCLDLVQWLNGHPECGFGSRKDPDAFAFSARLLLRRTACLSRPVPSVSSSCGSSDDSVQYSRVEELGRLELECYSAPVQSCVAEKAGEQSTDERDDEFAALRALVRDGKLPDGLRDPTGWVDAFRMVAAVTVAALAPSADADDPSSPRLFPHPTQPVVLLADLPRIVLTRAASDQPWQVDLGTIDLSVRRTHLPTWLIEELIAEVLAGRSGPVPVADQGGPRVRRVDFGTGRIDVDLTTDVLPGTVDDAVEVRWIDRADPAATWSAPLDVVSTLTPASDRTGTRLTLTFEVPAGSDVHYRLVLRGTGPTPLMGRSRMVPLSGNVGDPPGIAADGHDVVRVGS
jgi:hypothetical protein